jgi:hypothetical protein
MGIKKHGQGGYIGSDKKGRFVPGTKSTSWLGAWLALIILPLIGFGIAAPSILGSFLGSLVAVGAPFVIMAGAGLASIVGLVALWSTALWGWLKIGLTALIGWLFWELAFSVLEIGIEWMPTLSEIMDRWF